MCALRLSFRHHFSHSTASRDSYSSTPNATWRWKVLLELQRIFLSSSTSCQPTIYLISLKTDVMPRPKAPAGTTLYEHSKNFILKNTLKCFQVTKVTSFFRQTIPYFNYTFGKERLPHVHMAMVSKQLNYMRVFLCHGLHLREWTALLDLLQPAKLKFYVPRLSIVSVVTPSLRHINLLLSYRLGDATITAAHFWYDNMFSCFKQTGCALNL